MAPPTSSVLLQTLRIIADSKTDKMSQIREHKDQLLTLLSTEWDRTKCLVMICDRIETCHAISAGKFERLVLRTPDDADCPVFWPEFHNRLMSFIRQADQYLLDWVIMSCRWEITLLAHFNTMSARLEYDSLHANMVDEWLHAAGDDPKPGGTNHEAAPKQDGSGNRAKDKYRRQWEEDAFSPTTINNHALHQFLEDVSDREKAEGNWKADAMEDLSATIKRFEGSLTSPNQFHPTTLEWVISSLLASRRLSQRMRETLRDIKSNHPVLDEISDVLNSRMQSLGSWSWGGTVSLDFRSDVKDKYIIDMQEDLLQAIFLHYIGVKWSGFFKDILPSFFSSNRIYFGAGQALSRIDKQKHTYFRSSYDSRVVKRARHSMYREQYLVNRLLDMETQGAEEAEAEMKRVYTNDPVKSRTQFAQILSAERSINIRLHGEFTVLQSSFSRWNDLLPHATVLGVLEFMGVSGNWLLFFLTFLKAPLRFRTDPSDSKPRTRRRGIPDSHVLSDVLSEVVLFWLDCAVHQATGGRLLYRSFGDMWFWSPSEAHVVRAWATLQGFARVTGTQLCGSNSGCVRIFRPDLPVLPIDSSLPQGEIRWGLLRLSPVTGRFEINQDRVNSHVRAVGKSLRRNFKSTFSLIRELNSQQERLFHLLGVKANSLGRDHVTMVLHTYAPVERQILQYDAEARNGNNLGDCNDATEYLRTVSSQLFAVSDIPDAYLFFPTELGGLGLKSASIALHLIRDLASESSSSLLGEFQYTERRGNRLQLQRETFRSLRRDPASISHEYKTWREKLHYGYGSELIDVYCRLLESPSLESSLYDNTGLHALMSGPYGSDTLQNIASGNFPGIGSYWRRVILLYGQEAMEIFGSLKLVDMELLPKGTFDTSKDGQ